MACWKYLQDESGAVTVDWVTLTAATVGLGIAAASAVSMGVRSLGTDVQESLSGASVARLYDFMGTSFTLASIGFEDGNTEGWSSDRIGFTDALGHFLGPFAGSEGAVEYAVRLPSDTVRAVIEFDLLTLDSWDGWNHGGGNDVAAGGRGDGVAFLIDGQEIHYSGMTVGTAQFPTGSFEVDGTTYNVTMVNQRTGQFTDANMSANSAWPDGVWRVQVVAENPPPQGFNFGLNATTNQHVRDESMGIDNFSINSYRE